MENNLVSQSAINPTTNFCGKLNFHATEYNKQNSINYNDILSQTISSSANFSKRWMITAA
jgi:hypothetical protein